VVTIDPATHEPGTVRIFNAVLTAGDCSIIAGAHRGFFASVMAALVGPKGKVFAFEPEPENYKALVETTKDFGNVETFNFALGNKETTAPFYVNSDNDGGHALWDVALHPNNEKTREQRTVLTIEVKTIDGLLGERDLSRLKLLILDAEGAEHAILKGAMNTIVDNDVPYVICEVNAGAMEHCNTSQMGLRGFMSLYGYKGYLILEDRVSEIANTPLVVNGADESGYVFNMLFSRVGKV
jgi:FkbM family methyltransferase